MKRVAEIMHIPDGEREEFLKGALNPDEETKKVLWMCGVRNQQYFGLNDLIFMTFEYGGDNFADDMDKMANYLNTKGLLVNKRRKDVPVEDRPTTAWWAPVKKLGTLFDSESSVQPDKDWDTVTLGMYSQVKNNYDISFSEDDWSESMHF